MPTIPFCGPTYNGRSLNVDASRCVNFYPEVTGTQDNKTQMCLVGTPGTALFGTNLGTAPVRGLHVVGSVLYAVIDDKLYSVATDGTLTSRGSLTTSTGRVSMSDNGLSQNGIGGNQLIIVDGANGYIYNVSTLAFSTIASAGGWTDLLSGSHYPLQVDYLDGYFIVINGSMSFWVSNLYDGTTYNALATSPVSASPDTIVGLAAHSQRIFFFKQNTTEIWYDVGTPTASGSPFLRQSGAVYDFGCASRWTIAKGAGLLFFLATQKMNNGGEVVGVAMVQESAPQIISTPAISWRIAQSTTHADSFAYCYTEEGHIFYVLTNPTDNWTLVYDATTNLWHERSSFASDSVTVNRHVGNCYAYFNNKHYIGDYRSSTILEMSSKYFNDNGNDIWSFRTAQTIFDPNELDHVFIHMLALDVETGVSGTEETLTVQAITPYQAGDNHYGPVQSGPDMADDDLPEVYRADIAAVATGFTTVAGSFAGILAGSKIKVTGFTNAAINTVYTAESLTDTAIHTVVHPTATESAGNAVTIYNYNDVLIKADGTIFGGASISGVMGAVAYLSWSNDGGHTWSNSYAADLGTAPVYNTRVRWRRLGYSNNRVFKIAIKAAVKKIVLGAYVEASK